MSSKGRSAAGYVPDPTGFFETPEYSTRAVIPFLNIKPGMRLLESGCGKGAIARVLREEFGDSISITGIEIDKKRAAFARKATAQYHSGSKSALPVFDEVVTSDFFKLAPPGAGGSQWKQLFDLDLSNPSFSIFQAVAEHSFQFCVRTCLLLPVNALASKGRFDWWEKYPAHLNILDKRPSFAKSVKCELGKKECSFQELIPIDAKPKALCPVCAEKGVESKTTMTSSDSNEYAFYEWRPSITKGGWSGCRTPAPRKKSK